MARTRTVADLIADVRVRADNQALTDDQILEFVNGSYSDWCDIVIREDAAAYFQQTVSVSTVGGTDSITLASVASDFFRLVGVWWQFNTNQFARLHRYMQAESEVFLPPAGWFYGSRIYYNIEGSDLRFVPTPNGAYTLKVKYIPEIARLLSGGSIAEYNGQATEFIVADAAAKCLEREGADPQEIAPLLARRDRCEARIVALAERDRSEPMRIQDVTHGPSWPWGH